MGRFYNSAGASFNLRSHGVLEGVVLSLKVLRSLGALETMAALPRAGDLAAPALENARYTLLPQFVPLRTVVRIRVDACARSCELAA